MHTFILNGTKPCITEMEIKNDDSVKEAPAYCRSFLDGLHNEKLFLQAGL